MNSTKKDQRKEEKKKALKTLREKLQGLTEEQKQALLDNFSVIRIENGKTLSPMNTVLTYFQKENATVVGTYNQWQEVGRQVKKGEKSFMIWFPMGKKDDNGMTIMPEDDDLRFGMASYFDISQTEKMGEVK